MNKVLLREVTKKMCDSLQNEDIISHSNIIAQKLYGNEKFKKAKNIFIYISFRNEIRTYGIIVEATKQGKNVFVPKIFGSEMRAVKCDLQTLRANKYGVMEPENTETIDENMIDICITPGVVFDIQKNRVGYGQGYYDKFFRKYPDVYKIALAHDIQVALHIQSEEHDITVDEIITEKRTI